MTQAPLKILHIVTKSGLGGAQRYVFDLATRLPRDEFEPVVAFGPAPGTSQPGRLASELADAGIRTVFLPSLGRDVRLLDDLATLRALVRLMRAEAPAVVHLNSSKAGFLGAIAARIARVPRIVFTAHGWPFAEPRPLPWRALIWLLSWKTALLSHEIVCISDADRRVALQMPFVGTRVHLIPNGIGAKTLLPRNEARASLFPTGTDAHTDDIWCVSIAELNKNKDIATALAAVAEHNRTHAPSIFYCVIGAGDEEEALRARAETLHLSDAVAFLGAIPDAARYLTAFDLFLLTSRKEGLPYALLEAGAAGLAVVASATGGIPDVVRNEREGLLCPPGDAHSFAEALALLSGDGPLRQRLAGALTARVATHFTLERMLAETAALYRS